ncbi:hypothetical protein JCM3766R1_007026 [Sporobolomyces carnicolor]
MVRLDADLIARTPSYLSPLKDRELDLRGHKIPAIENLGVTKDQLESLDLTDNAITSVSNFPLLRRLHQLLLANNPVRTISPSIATSLPNLATLVLTNSAVPKESLAIVGDTLAKCKKLQHLSLKGSPVAQAEHYKEWIVFSCKKLTSLDFDRIRQKDREHANSLFLTAASEPTPLHQQFISLVQTGRVAPSLTSKTFEPGVEQAETTTTGAGAGNAGRLLSKEEKDRVRTAIEKAESVEEIRRLQRMLAQGFIPSEKDLKDLEKAKTGRTNGEVAA